MRAAVVFGFTLLLLTAGRVGVVRAADPAGTGTTPPVDSTAAASPMRLFIVHFLVGPSWKSDRPPQEQTKFKEHGANLKRLRDEGRIVLGARYSDKGFIVLRSSSSDAAQKEIAADPGILAGIFTFELFELHPFYEGCLTRAGG